MTNFKFNVRRWISGLTERFFNMDNWKRKPSGKEFDVLMFRLAIAGIIFICFGIYFLIKGYLFYKNEMNLNILPTEQIIVNQYAKAEINMCQGPVCERKQAESGKGKKYLYVVPVGTDSLNYMFLEADDTESEKNELDFFAEKSEEHLHRYGNLYKMDKKTIRGHVRNLPLAYREIYDKLQEKGGYGKNYIPYYIDFGSDCDGERYLQSGKYFIIAAMFILAIWWLGQTAVSSLVKFIMQ